MSATRVESMVKMWKVKRIGSKKGNSQSKLLHQANWRSKFQLWTDIDVGENWIREVTLEGSHTTGVLHLVFWYVSITRVGCRITALSAENFFTLVIPVVSLICNTAIVPTVNCTHFEEDNSGTLTLAKAFYHITGVLERGAIKLINWRECPGDVMHRHSIPNETSPPGLPWWGTQ
jgi:hypothetical protein